MTENGLRGATVEEDYSNGHAEEHGQENGKVRLNEVAQKYIQDLLAERSRMENQFPLAVKLIDEALERVKLNGRIPTREQYADVYQQRTIKLSQKVHVPIKDKKFNYVGKLLGPKGNSLRRLQEETQCKIVILGRFSMKDRAREEELRNSADAKYAHLNLPLHVEVSTIAPPAEAYARIAYALAEIRKYLIPDKHDDIRHEQFRELMEDPEAAKKLAMRQQQQQQQQQNHHQQVAYRGNGANHYGRPKFQSQSQHYAGHNEEHMYYRTNYHQPKPYIQQRPNHIQAGVPSQAVAAGSNSGGMMSTGYQGRANGMSGIISNAGGGSGGGGVGAGPMRYRLAPYQFAKK